MEKAGAEAYEIRATSSGKDFSVKFEEDQINYASAQLNEYVEDVKTGVQDNRNWSENLKITSLGNIKIVVREVKVFSSHMQG